MVNKNKFLAIVLARKGSKRLKNKNILNIGGKPLISWTLDFLDSLKKNFVDVLVYSDSNKIINLSKKKNFIVIYRPKKYSHDKITSETSTLDALKKYDRFFKKSYSHVFLFQPTTPFRIKNHILLAIKKSLNKKNIRIISCKKNKKGVPEANGSFYLISSQLLKKSKNFVGKKFTPIICKSNKYNIDIDTKQDLINAKKYF
jgi:CMP-N,N'-diacetyllegionaminic acid synthase